MAGCESGGGGGTAFKASCTAKDRPRLVRQHPACRCVRSQGLCSQSLQTARYSLCCRTYTDGGCYMKGDSWTAESREGLISGYYSSS